jgi:hypothetical protein
MTPPSSERRNKKTPVMAGPQQRLAPTPELSQGTVIQQGKPESEQPSRSGSQVYVEIVSLNLQSDQVDQSDVASRSGWTAESPHSQQRILITFASQEGQAISITTHLFPLQASQHGSRIGQHLPIQVAQSEGAQEQADDARTIREHARSSYFLCLCTRYTISVKEDQSSSSASNGWAQTTNVQGRCK